MSIIVQCKCGQAYQVADRHSGKQGNCPKCKKPLVVPALNSRHDSPAVAPNCAPVRIGHVPNYPNELPPPPDALKVGSKPFIEVYDGMKIIHFDELSAAREALLVGAINRHYLSRWVEFEPTETGLDKDQFRHALNEWERRKRWRSIGKGLATEESTIKLLYDPMGVYANRGFVAVTTVFAIPLIALMLVVIWKDGVWSDRYGRGGGVVALILRQPGVAQELYSAMGAIMAVVLAMIPGYAMGAPIGIWVAERRLHSFPRPPADGWELKGRDVKF